MIPYGRQDVTEADIDAVVAVLRGDWLTQGPDIERFEQAVAAQVGARHAVAFSNGTTALHAATAAAGLGPGDVVATSSLSFVASAACARYVGADVRLVDIEPETLNLNPALVPECDALVAVHYAGLPFDLGALRRRPRVVIEDAAHALGAETPDGPVGNCARSDMCMFSFHPVKAITTGEGGIITTNSARLDERLRRFRSHGVVRRPSRGGWYYEVTGLGHNFRLTDVAAALGTSQLARLGTYVERRNDLAEGYRKKLSGLDVILPPAAPPGWRHGYHLFPIRVRNRAQVYDRLRERGIGVQVHYVPIHRHPYYRVAGSELPETERAYRGLLSIPLFPGLTDDEQDLVVAELEEVLA